MGVTGKKEVRDTQMVALAAESAVVRNAKRFQRIHELLATIDCSITRYVRFCSKVLHFCLIRIDSKTQSDRKYMYM